MNLITVKRVALLLIGTGLGLTLQAFTPQTSSGPKDTARINYYRDQAYTYGIYYNNYQIYMDSALSLDPTNAYFWQQKAMPLFKMNKPELAMPYLDSAVKFKPDYIDYRAFMKCIFQRNYAGAITDFKSSIQQKGHSFIMDHSYDFYMGLSYLQINNLQMADSLIRHSCDFYTQRKMAPHFLELFYLGIIQMEKTQFTEAIKTFDEVTAIYPQLPDAIYYRAFCMEMQARKENDTRNQDAALLKLYQSGLDYYQKGYAINEDNAIYMDYPYQVRRHRYENAIGRLAGGR